MTAARRKLLHILLFLVLLATLLFATGALFAQIATRSGEHVSVNDVLPDMGFFAAGELTITAKSNDDLFAVGGDISINGAEADHMIVAGGDINVTDVAFRDLIIAGGDVTLASGVVADDLAAAAGDLNVRAAFEIGGSAVVSGGHVTLEASVPGELRAAGRRVRIDANIGGDAHVTGDDVFIGPNVRIGGDLRHRARTIKIDPGAVIEGEVVALEPSPGPDFEKWGVRTAAAAALFVLAFLVGVGVLVIAIVAVLPALMNSAAAMIREKPLATLGIGFLVAAAAPIVIAFLFATIFGIPLALLIAFFYAAAAPLAIAAFAYFVGISGRRMLAGNEPQMPGLAVRVLWSAGAVGALIIVGLIPFLGQLVWLLAYVFGVGAVMTRGGKALAQKA